MAKDAREAYLIQPVLPVAATTEPEAPAATETRSVFEDVTA